MLPERHEEEVILNARLELYAGSTTTTNPGAMGVYRATKQWTSAASWEKRNVEASWETPGGDFAEGGANDWINSSVGAGAGWVYWYPTRLVQEWYDGSDAPAGQWQPDLGFLIKYASEGQVDNVVSFDGREEREHDPQLSITTVRRGFGDSSRYANLTAPLTSSESLDVNPASGNLTVHASDFSIADDGFEFDSARGWNSLGPNALNYAEGWADSNAVYIEPFKGSGAVAFTDRSGAAFAFIKEGASFLTPPGIEARMCAAGSPSPCPEQLPTGVEYQLIYAQSGEHIDFGGKKKYDYPIDVIDASGQTLTAGYGTKVEEPISWTDAEGTKIAYTATAAKGYTKITDEGTGQSTLYGYEQDPEFGFYRLSKYTSMSGAQTGYSYGEGLEGELLRQIALPNGEVVKLAYDNSREDRVTRVERLANAEATNGTLTTYTYYGFGQAPAPCTVTQKGTLVSGPEMEGEVPQQTLYCANALDEVEGGTNLTAATGQPGWYALIEEEDTSSAVAAVNVAGGNLFVENEDLIPSEASEQIGLDRYYNSLAPSSQSKGLGPRWSWGVGPDVYLTISGETIVLHGPNGYVVTLHQSGSSYVAPEEFEGVLTENENGTYTLAETEEGDTYQFNASGTMTSYSNEEGQTFTVADTTLSGKSLLHTITPVGGKALEVKYNSTPYVSEVKSPDGNIRKYAYNSNGQLSSFTNPSGEKTEYEYTNGYLSKIKTPNGSTETIASEGGRVSEVSISESGGAIHGYRFTYQAPAEPTCTPATDAGETIVTETPEEAEEISEIYCYDALGQITHYSGPPAGESEAPDPTEAEPEEQEEAPTGTCYEDPNFTAEECGQEEFPSENEESEAQTQGAFAARASGAPGELPHQDYGMADDFALEGGNGSFDIFNSTFFNGLHVKYVRATPSWNVAWEAKHGNATAAKEVEGLQTWVKDVKALDGGTGEPLVSFEHCPKSNEWVNPLKTSEKKSCDIVPEVPEYRAAMKAFRKEAGLSEVHYYTAWNEPDNKKKETEGKVSETGKPTAFLAGEYWRALTAICKNKEEGSTPCQVVAGDFADKWMQDANDNRTLGGQYFAEYARGMGHPETATMWAWHSYQEGEEIARNARNPSTWWKPFHNFVAAVDKKSGFDSKAKAASDIWLTEQGVLYYFEGHKHHAAKSKFIAKKVMAAYVNDGTYQLTRQSKQITRFFYYAMRGDPNFDSGLLYQSEQERPRAIYKIYCHKTPKPEPCPQ